MRKTLEKKIDDELKSSQNWKDYFEGYHDGYADAKQKKRNRGKLIR